MPRPPPPPRPPQGPEGEIGDAVALGISLPLLVVALASAFGFIFKRVSGGAAARPKRTCGNAAPVAVAWAGGVGRCLADSPRTRFCTLPRPHPHTFFAPAGAKGGAVKLAVLPPGWKMLVDPSTGSPFYTNEATGERQWEPPSSGAVTNDLPPGWHAQVHT